MERRRPLGITILSILSFIAAIWFILIGLGLVIAGGLIETQALQVGPITESSFAGSFAIGFGIFFLVVAVFNLFLSVGYWTLKPWAWTLGVVVQALTLISGLAAVLLGNPSSLVEIVIAAIIFIYLMTPGVKAAFGKGPAPA